MLCGKSICSTSGPLNFADIQCDNERIVKQLRCPRRFFAGGCARVFIVEEHQANLPAANSRALSGCALESFDNAIAQLPPEACIA